MDVSNVSRSGRIRKKSSKLADFESPDEIDAVNQIKKPAKPASTVSFLRNWAGAPVHYRLLFQASSVSKTVNLGSSGYFIDSLPPDQLMADAGKSSEEDEHSDQDIDFTEDDLNAIPDEDDTAAEEDEQIDVEDSDDGTRSSMLTDNLSNFR